MNNFQHLEMGVLKEGEGNSTRQSQQLFSHRDYSSQRLNTHQDLQLRQSTPSQTHRLSRTPLQDKPGSQYSSVKRTVLTETIFKKEEDLLKRLSDLQDLGSNKSMMTTSKSQDRLADGCSTHNLNTETSLYKNDSLPFLYSTHQGVMNTQKQLEEIQMQKGFKGSHSNQFLTSNQDEELKEDTNRYGNLNLEYRAREEDQQFIEKMRKQYLVEEKLPQELFSPKSMDKTSSYSQNLLFKEQQPIMPSDQKQDIERIIHATQNSNKKMKTQIYQSYDTRKPDKNLINESVNEEDIIKSWEEDKKEFEELEQVLVDELQKQKLNQQKMYLQMKSNQRSGQKQCKQGAQKIRLRSPRQAQPLSPQQKPIAEEKAISDLQQQEKQKKKANKARKKWTNNQQQQENKILFEQYDQEKWSKINEMLGKIRQEKIMIEESQSQVGPVEESMIRVMYSLIREVQNLQRRVERGDYDETQRLERELTLQRDITLKQEQSIFKLEQQVEFLKHQDKKEYVGKQSNSKMLEKQVKDMKSKVLVSENLVQKKQQEFEVLKQKYEKKIQEDERYLIRDRLAFEKHFGKMPRSGEEKYVNFLKMYESQREKQEKQVEALEKELIRLNKATQELENENFALSKGQLPAQEAHYFTKGDGQMSLKLRDMENQNLKLQEALQKYASDFKDLLKEIEKLKGGIRDRDKQMEAMEQEMRARPSLSSINANQIFVKNLEQEVVDLRRQNNELHNELMLIRNQTGTHIKQSSVQSHPGSLSIRQGRGCMLSGSDAKLVIEEIQDILKLENDEPALIIDAIRKLEKVVKAVPRMENFIQNITKQLSEDGQQVSVELVIPKIQYWKDIVVNQYHPLLQFKRDLTVLLFQRDNLQLQANDLLKEVERIIIEKEYTKQQQKQETEQQRAINYMLQLFEVNDSKLLLEKVNQTFVYVTEFNAFLKISRSILHMDQGVTVTTCLNTIRSILINFTNGANQQFK